MARLSLVSVNIERDKHLGRVEKFLERIRPDAVCMQELLQDDIPRFESIVGACVFAPATQIEVSRGRLVEGVGIFSRLPLKDAAVRQYYGREGGLGVQLSGSPPEEKVRQRRYVAALATFEKEGVPFRLATTHFLWTIAGSVSDEQREALASLLASLESEELVLCGDFNAPRGGEIFSVLAERYVDAIPAHYVTSLDPTLHRGGQEVADKMVDGLFLTPTYAASDVELVPGISDHCAIVATLEKVPVGVENTHVQSREAV